VDIVLYTLRYKKERKSYVEECFNGDIESIFHQFHSYHTTILDLNAKIGREDIIIQPVWKESTRYNINNTMVR
jgi:hypothetical protein